MNLPHEQDGRAQGSSLQPYSSRVKVKHKLSLCFIFIFVTLIVTKMEIAEFGNSVDPDEVAHNEPPHLDLHCLPSNL